MAHIQGTSRAYMDQLNKAVLRQCWWLGVPHMLGSLHAQLAARLPCCNVTDTTTWAAPTLEAKHNLAPHKHSTQCCWVVCDPVAWQLSQEWTHACFTPTVQHERLMTSDSRN